MPEPGETSRWANGAGVGALYLCGLQRDLAGASLTVRNVDPCGPMSKARYCPLSTSTDNSAVTKPGSVTSTALQPSLSAGDQLPLI